LYIVVGEGDGRPEAACGPHHRPGAPGGGGQGREGRQGGQGRQGIPGSQEERQGL